MTHSGMSSQVTGKPVFILGVGAPKAGTTWLHRQLSNDSKANMGLIKEYHVWDAISNSTFAGFLGRHTWDKDQAKQALRSKMQSDTSFYFEYFAELLSKPGIELTGDLTPSYGTLEPETLVKIRYGMESLGIQVKVVFLMRDPVERCWSQVRMHRRNAKQEDGFKKFRNLVISEQLQLALTYRNSRMSQVTRYDQTIQNIQNIFDKSDIYYGIFETMFSSDELRRLSNFLEIDIPFSSIKDKQNSSPKKIKLSRPLSAGVASYYDSVYRFCNDRFPVTCEVWKRRRVTDNTTFTCD